MIWERIVNGNNYQLWRTTANRPSGRWYWTFLLKNNEVIFQTLTQI